MKVCRILLNVQCCLIDHAHDGDAHVNLLHEVQHVAEKEEDGKKEPHRLVERWSFPFEFVIRLANEMS